MHGAECYCLARFRAGGMRGAANVDVVSCSRLAEVYGWHARDGGGALHWHASVPLVVGERRLGMLNVASRDRRALSAEELDLLTTAGVLVSLAVERSRLEGAVARAAAAEERNRLAREIHDTLAQALAALALQLEVTDALAAGHDDARLSATVARALALARSALDEARRSVLDLRAAPLEGRSLADALERLAEETRAAARDAGHALDLRVVCTGTDRAELPAALEVGLYRIAEQALANVLRHAGARSARVRLTRGERGEVRLRVEDDGAGFDPAAVPTGRFGLVGMSERARLLGGALTVETAPGAGTTIDVTVPARARAEWAAPAARA
jgi:two-component system NarL family sensor kinase